MSKESGNLGNFEGWNESDSEMDFFGVSSNPEAVQSIGEIQEESSTEETEGSTKESIKEDPEEKIRKKLFEEEDDLSDYHEEDSSEEDESAKNLTNPKVVSQAIRVLAKKGLISVEEKDIPKKEEDLESYLEEVFTKSVDDRIEEIVLGYPDIVKNLVKYTHNGGDPHKFIQEVAANKPKQITADMDLSSKENQEMIVRAQLYAEGYDQDYADSQIEFLEDSGRLEKAARTHFKRWEEQENLRQKEIVKQQREMVLKEKEGRQRARIELADLIAEKETFGGIKLSPEDKREIPDYITNRKVQLQNGRIVTPMEVDLHEILQSGEKTILLAKLIRSGMDLSTLEKQIKTKVASEVKEGIRRTKSLGAPQSSLGGKQSKSLSDFF